MARVTVRLPEPLQSHAGGRSAVEVDADTAYEALRRVGRLSPGMEAHLFEAGGKLRPGVHVYLEGTNLRSLDAKARTLEEGDELVVVPAISGG